MSSKDSKHEGLEGATPLRCWLHAILGICPKCFRMYQKNGSFEMFPHNASEQMEAAPINSCPVYTSKELRYIAVKDPFWWSDSLQRIGEIYGSF